MEQVYTWNEIAGTLRAVLREKTDTGVVTAILEDLYDGLAPKPPKEGE